MLKNIIKPIYRIAKRICLEIKYFFLCRNDLLEKFLSDKKDFCLFITHSLGGGTFQYEKNYLKENSEKKIIILRIFSYGKDLCYRLENKQTGEEIYISAKNVSRVFDNEFNEVIINSLIQIYDLFVFIDLLLEYKTKYAEIQYTYHVHDFHCVCPQQNLIANDWYCNLECNRHNCRFDKFVYRYNGTIDRYREKWGKLLLNSDKIICFSESSMNIVKSAYKLLDIKKIVVKPHDMSYCNFTPIKVSNSTNIAIVGACNSTAKGKLVIEKILRELPENLKIFMIGSSKKLFSIKRKNIFWYGTYKHDDLPKILEDLEISKVVFPSVCPETFSYVVSELMQMHIPIIAFDFGAQGEKLKHYDKGVLCKDIDDMITFVRNNIG